MTLVSRMIASALVNAVCETIDGTTSDEFATEDFDRAIAELTGLAPKQLHPAQERAVLEIVETLKRLREETYSG